MSRRKLLVLTIDVPTGPLPSFSPWAPLTRRKISTTSLRKARKRPQGGDSFFPPLVRASFVSFSPGRQCPLSFRFPVPKFSLRVPVIIKPLEPRPFVTCFCSCSLMILLVSFSSKCQARRLAPLLSSCASMAPAIACFFLPLTPARGFPHKTPPTGAPSLFPFSEALPVPIPPPPSFSGSFLSFFPLRINQIFSEIKRLPGSGPCCHPLFLFLRFSLFQSRFRVVPDNPRLSYLLPADVCFSFPLSFICSSSYVVVGVFRSRSPDRKRLVLVGPR